MGDDGAAARGHLLGLLLGLILFFQSSSSLASCFLVERVCARALFSGN